jgi:hypothetical protein
LAGLRPNDELEGMMAAQLMASHNAAMECYRRAMLGDQTFEGRRENLNQANKLSRTWGTLLEALNRHRGKGQQKVTVEHVHVHAGGQAMVGMVETQADSTRVRTEESHAKQITHAPEPALRSSDEAENALPVARNEERPLPNARRNRTPKPTSFSNETQNSERNCGHTFCFLNRTSSMYCSNVGIWLGL